MQVRADSGERRQEGRRETQGKEGGGTEGKEKGKLVSWLWSEGKGVWEGSDEAVLVTWPGKGREEAQGRGLA